VGSAPLNLTALTRRFFRCSTATARLLPCSLVSRVLSLLLLGAAVLKLNGLAVEPVAGGGIFAAPEVQVAAVEI